MVSHIFIYILVILFLGWQTVIATHIEENGDNGVEKSHEHYLQLKNFHSVQVTEQGVVTTYTKELVIKNGTVIEGNTPISTSASKESFDLQGSYVLPGMFNSLSGFNLGNIPADNWSRSGATGVFLIGTGNPFQLLRYPKAKRDTTLIYFEENLIPYRDQAADIYYSGPLLQFSSERTRIGGVINQIRKIISSSQVIYDVTEAHEFLVEHFDAEPNPKPNEESLPGADFIYLDFRIDRSPATTFPRHILHTLISGAHERGKKVIALIETVSDAEAASEWAVDIFHLPMESLLVETGKEYGQGEPELKFSLDQEDFRTLAGLRTYPVLKKVGGNTDAKTKPIYLLTTLTTLQGIGKVERKYAQYEELLLGAGKRLSDYIDAGGLALLGSSHGKEWMQGGFPAEETKAYLAAGISLADVLRALMVNPLNLVKPVSSSSTKNGENNYPNFFTPGQVGNFIVIKNETDQTINVENKNTFTAKELTNLSTSLQMVIKDGVVIRNDLEKDYHLKFGFAFTKNTRTELLTTSLNPLNEEYPNTLHWIFGVNMGAVLLHNINKHLEIGLYQRLMSPQGRHWLELSTSYIFYGKGLLHLEGGYTYFMDADLRFGIGPWSSYVPTEFLQTGLRFQIKRTKYPFIGSRQWLEFDLFLNYESYAHEQANWLVVRTDTRFNLYDLLPPWIDAINFNLSLEGAYHLNPNLENERNLLRRTGEQFSVGYFFNSEVDLRYFSVRHWNGRIWGDSLRRFFFTDSIGKFRSFGTVGRVRSNDIDSGILGLFTSLKYPFLFAINSNININTFWEMQKVAPSLAQIIKWDNDWVIDFGGGVGLVTPFTSVDLGVYVPVDYKGKLSKPGFYLTFSFLQ